MNGAADMGEANRQPRVFLVDDDDDLRPALVQALELDDLKTTGFASPLEALDHISRDFYGVVVTDIKMPGIDGLEFLKRLLEIDPALPVIVITGHADVPLAVQSMQMGAYDFLEKPFPSQQLTNVAGRAIEKRRLVLENRALRNSITLSGDLSDTLVGNHPAMQRLRNEVLALADTDADVLVYGETGSGKEVVSRALHRMSTRAPHPFVALNCGALPADIIESELFGHERGAFTGAHERRIGKLEHADGGTVLLDEIESMPLDVQIKLLRVIEERKIERLGSNLEIPINVRFVAASKKDLKTESEAGRFRQDLFYRLNVASLTIPPLRERSEDIPQLFYHLAREARAKFRKEIPDVDEQLLARLAKHDWQGNVRELRNVAERFVLGLGTGFEPERNGGSRKKAGVLLADQMAAHEREIIAEVLLRHEGRIKPAYEELGVSRKTFYDKMKRYGL